MTAKDITLNIAVNLGRLGRWAMEGKAGRIKPFLAETQKFMDDLEKAPKSERFGRTYLSFKQKFQELSQDVRLDETWAEEMFTWANILTHRAKLA